MYSINSRNSFHSKNFSNIHFVIPLKVRVIKQIFCFNIKPQRQIFPLTQDNKRGFPNAEFKKGCYITNRFFLCCETSNTFLHFMLEKYFAINRKLNFLALEFINLRDFCKVL